jgi:hypothetical protein
LTCPHCQRGTHLQNGVHMGELEMHRCMSAPMADGAKEFIWELYGQSLERVLTLEPMTNTPKIREVWHQPARRTDLPFTSEGRA